LIDISLIQACTSGDRRAQQTLYAELSPMIYSVCRRYLKQDCSVEDAFAETFVIIFTKMATLKEPAAVFGWARRIAVNQCLQMLRKQVSFNVALEDIKYEPEYAQTSSQKLEHNDLLQLVQLLPDGCRSIFNLFVIEGYSHKEIATMLRISEGTSKSQVNVARMKLQKLVAIHYEIKSDENGIAR
jgi:RNA polymerase sigma factor (sigma-70 family)